jgi:uncharacterized protein (DUF1330 family)
MEMKYLLTTAAIVTSGIIGAGTVQYLHAAGGPEIYNVYETNVTDEDAYKKALPEVLKLVKENGGVYLAGGFNKAKVDHGSPAAGNRFVIIRYPDEAAYDKFWNGGGSAWLEKNAPHARSVKVEGAEMK